MEKIFETIDNREYVVYDCMFIPDGKEAEPIEGLYAVEYDDFNQKIWEGVCGNFWSVSEICDAAEFDFALETEYWDSYYRVLESVKIINEG